MPGSKGLSPHELAHKWVKDLMTRPDMRQTKELSEAEFYSLMESILNLPQAEHFIRSATENHARISGQEKGGD